MRFFSILLFLAFYVDCSAQSLFWNTSTNDKSHQAYRRALGQQFYSDDAQPEFDAFRLSPNSFFTGAGTVYDFDFGNTTNVAFSNRFSVTGDLIMNIIPSFSFLGTIVNVPFRGNIQGFLFGQDIDATYQLGIYPFFQLPETNASTDWIVHLGFEGKINPVEEGFDASRRDTRIFAGVESVIYIRDNSKPVVIGVNSIYEKVVQFDGSSFGAEASIIFELMDGIAIASRGYWGWSGKQYRGSGFQIGIALTGPSKG